ncbi:hypothetical protein ANN_20650 [Periplaneta americana]|uniref:MADF domain-containing protein n=1 Tax=Periplaneta americana TaxID=6978 RepID=A0ABQ8SEB4_PERAM|nr:hypothetical protein ANN_20650 [Periplaneta americana]
MCHGSMYAVMWLADEPREFNLPTLPQRCITCEAEKLPSKYGVHSEEYVPIRTYHRTPVVEGDRKRCFRFSKEKSTGRQIHKEATLRKKYVQHAYEKCLREVKCKLQNEKIRISIDESVDSVGRHVANVVVAALSAECCCRPYLLMSEVLERVNYSTICELFDSAMELLWPSCVQFKMCYYAASYMKKSAKFLETRYPNMIHLTCLAHAYHSSLQRINTADKNSIKHITMRVSLFQIITPGIPLPPQPVLTRSGTWLDAVNYYAEHYGKIMEQENCDITYALFCSVLCIMEQVSFDEVLILSVEENPHVYDKRRASYKDEKMKENTWLSIAASLNTDRNGDLGGAEEMVSDVFYSNHCRKDATSADLNLFVGL